MGACYHAGDNCAVSMNVIDYVFYSYYVSQFLKTFADRVISKAQEVCSLANAYYSSYIMEVSLHGGSEALSPP